MRIGGQCSHSYFGEVFSSTTMAGCTVYVLTGNNFRRFLWLPTLCSWTLVPDHPSVTLITDSEWCLCGADTLALCAMSWVVARWCPTLDTVLKSLLEPCHLSVSLDEPELALESLPWAAAGFSESLLLTTTTADSLSLLNLQISPSLSYQHKTNKKYQKLIACEVFFVIF